MPDKNHFKLAQELRKHADENMFATGQDMELGLHIDEETMTRLRTAAKTIMTEGHEILHQFERTFLLMNVGKSAEAYNGFATAFKFFEELAGEAKPRKTAGKK